LFTMNTNNTPQWSDYFATETETPSPENLLATYQYQLRYILEGVQRFAVLEFADEEFEQELDWWVFKQLCQEWLTDIRKEQAAQS